tara:strand:- start:8074 stop:8529 length:456 start_codon:yes stop_codon:yes gene_type:complete
MKKVKLLKEPFVQDSIISYLKEQGWNSNLVSKNLTEVGVDIKVRNNKFSRYWLIEVKGDPSEKVKSPSGIRSSSFNSALGQIITRMHTNRKRGYKYGYKYGMGFPSSYKKMALKKLPYDVCDKLNLYLFFVNNKGEVEEFDHRKIKKKQNA